MNPNPIHPMNPMNPANPIYPIEAISPIDPNPIFPFEILQPQLALPLVRVSSAYDTMVIKLSMEKAYERFRPPRIFLAVLPSDFCSGAAGKSVEPTHSGQERSWHEAPALRVLGLELQNLGQGFAWWSTQPRRMSR